METWETSMDRSFDRGDWKIHNEYMTVYQLYRMSSVSSIRLRGPILKMRISKRLFMHPFCLGENE